MNDRGQEKDMVLNIKQIDSNVNLKLFLNYFKGYEEIEKESETEYIVGVQGKIKFIEEWEDWGFIDFDDDKEEHPYNAFTFYKEWVPLRYYKDSKEVFKEQLKSASLLPPTKIPYFATNTKNFKSSLFNNFEFMTSSKIRRDKEINYALEDDYIIVDKGLTYLIAPGYSSYITRNYLVKLAQKEKVLVLRQGKRPLFKKHTPIKELVMDEFNTKESFLYFIRYVLSAILEQNEFKVVFFHKSMNKFLLSNLSFFVGKVLRHFSNTKGITFIWEGDVVNWKDELNFENLKAHSNFLSWFDAIHLYTSRYVFNQHNNIRPLLTKLREETKAIRDSLPLDKTSIDLSLYMERAKWEEETYFYNYTRSEVKIVNSNAIDFFWKNPNHIIYYITNLISTNSTYSKYLDSKTNTINYLYSTNIYNILYQDLGKTNKNHILVPKYDKLRDILLKKVVEYYTPFAREAHRVANSKKIELGTFYASGLVERILGKRKENEMTENLQFVGKQAISLIENLLIQKEKSLKAKFNNDFAKLMPVVKEKKNKLNTLKRFKDSKEKVFVLKQSRKDYLFIEPKELNSPDIQFEITNVMDFLDFNPISEIIAKIYIDKYNLESIEKIANIKHIKGLRKYVFILAYHYLYSNQDSFSKYDLLQLAIETSNFLTHDDTKFSHKEIRENIDKLVQRPINFFFGS